MSFILSALTLLILLIHVPRHTYAGHIIGNGGVVLLCRDSEKTYFRSYDTTEMEILTGEPPLLSSKENAKDKALDLVNRLQDINPTRSNLYKRSIENFESEAHFLPKGVRLEKTNDISIGVYPENCQIEQAIVQKNFPGIDGKTYLINSSIWNALNEDTKAALIIHEVVFREGLQPENGHINSIFTRQFTQLLHSKKIFSISLEEFHNFLVKNLFSTADTHDGFPMILFARGSLLKDTLVEYPREYWNSEIIKSAFPGLKVAVQYKNLNLSYGCDMAPWIENLVNANLTYDSQGKIRKLDLPCSKITLPLDIPNLSGHIDVSHLEWDENNDLRFASGIQYEKSQIEIIHKKDTWIYKDFRGSFKYSPQKELTIDYIGKLPPLEWQKNGIYSSTSPKTFFWNTKNQDTEIIYR